VEDQKERLIRYLDDAWSVEKALVAALDKMADDTDDPAAKALYQEHRQVTHNQEEQLEARIRALGEEPSGGKGFFSTMMAKIGDVMHKPHDEYDKTTQDLMKQYAIENFECAMYQSLRAYANAIGDFETVRLAEENLSQEQQTGQRVWNLIEPAATRPAAATPGVGTTTSLDAEQQERMVSG
jgi:ferritin-like metal-binding protein YciE